MSIEKQAKKILEDFEYLMDKPASISGKYHTGETFRDHLERCASIMRHLCDEFKIPEWDRDMLVACAYLHDIGNYFITFPWRVRLPQWKYFKESGCSRVRVLHSLHPLLSAMILDEYNIERKKEIQEIISTHMSHWYPHMEQPHTFYQKLLCIADYLSTRKDLFGYIG